MKTIKKTLLVVVLMLGTLVNYAKNENKFNTDKVKIVFDDTKKGHQLSVKDNKGTVLYTENIESEGKLTKVFNFDELHDGNYTLELEKDFQIVIKPLTIENNKVIFDENAERIIFKPFVKNKDNRLMVSKIAFNDKEVEIDLYYNNELIYSEVLEGNTVLKRVYRLDETIKGDYRVVIRDKDRNFVNKFKL